jgi:hypothetical protein
MLRTLPFDLSTLILAGLALSFGLIASWKDPRAPWIGVRNVRLTGGRFVAIRVLPSLAFPVIAGWLVKLCDDA